MHDLAGFIHPIATRQYARFVRRLGFRRQYARDGSVQQIAFGLQLCKADDLGLKLRRSPFEMFQHQFLLGCVALFCFHLQRRAHVIRQAVMSNRAQRRRRLQRLQAGIIAFRPRMFSVRKRQAETSNRRATHVGIVAQLNRQNGLRIGLKLLRQTQRNERCAPHSKRGAPTRFRIAVQHRQRRVCRVLRSGIRRHQIEFQTLCCCARRDDGFDFGEDKFIAAARDLITGQISIFHQLQPQCCPFACAGFDRDGIRFVIRIRAARNHQSFARHFHNA